MPIKLLGKDSFFYMGERVLEFLIYIIGGMSFILLGWAILRELFGKLNFKEQKKRNDLTQKLFKEWIQGPDEKRKTIVMELKKQGSAQFLEPFFFEFFERSPKNEQEEMRSLFELIGIQEFLRKTLHESSDLMKREKAALKLGRVGVMQDIPILLDVLRDPAEKTRVKECVSLSLYELSKELLNEKNAVANAALLVQLLEVQNPSMQVHIAKTISELSMPREDLIHHLLRLEADHAKEGALKVFEHWDDPELAPLLLDFLEDLHPNIRRAAVSLLGRWQNEDSLFLLFKKLEDPDPMVRVAAIEALFLYEHPAIKVQFKKHLDDPSVDVQIAYLEKLALLSDSDSVSTFIQKISDASFKSAWVSHLMNLNKDSLSKIFGYLGIDERIFIGKVGFAKANFEMAFGLTALESSNQDLRKKALEALKILKGRTLVDIAKQVLDKDPDKAVRHTAQLILNQFDMKKGG